MSAIIEGVPEETIRMMVLFGHARISHDGIAELTPIGSKWIQEWCAEQMAKQLELKRTRKHAPRHTPPP